MTLRKFFLAVAVILIALTAGCGGVSGTKVEQNDIAFIKKGVTTRAEVEKRLGKPDNAMPIDGTRSMAMYSYSEMTMPMWAVFVAKTKSKRVILAITYKDGVVENYEYTNDEKSYMNSIFGSYQTDDK
ncbi:MAG TPA: hypothetical protein VF803_03980 [Candidatus Paceibacterota bacterium]